VTASGALAAACSGRAGPLSVDVRAEDEALAAVAQRYLELFSRRWEYAPRSVEITMRRHRSGDVAYGSFLSAAHMSVDRNGPRYLADTQYGFVAAGKCDRERDEWCIDVPPETEFGEPETGDMEDIFSLICTVGWREEGYVALHAGAVVKDSTCAILCASSGGGKSTLTTALMHNGWQTLGDDKLLMRREHGRVNVRSLLQTFNLDPATRRWFDFGDLEALPRYSAWTAKRRVPLERIAPGSALAAAIPTHVVRVMRNSAVEGIVTREMSALETLPALLKQIVLPADREIAGSIVKEAAACAASVRGVTLEIGDDAYAHPHWLRSVEEALL
jgi:hypothetical protein